MFSCWCCYWVVFSIVVDAWRTLIGTEFAVMKSGQVILGVEFYGYGWDIGWVFIWCIYLEGFVHRGAVACCGLVTGYILSISCVYSEYTDD